MSVATNEAGKNAAELLGRALERFSPGRVPAETHAPSEESGIDEPVAVSKQELLERGWAALPESYRIPEVAPTLDEARAWCQHLAETHYENFHVATWFLPKALRPHFHAIYAYCRVSDDLGDEVGSTAEALALLEQWGEELDACYAGHARHPVFVALAETIRDVLDSEGAVCRSADRVSPGPDGDALRDHGRCAGLLPLLGEPCGQAGALCMRRSG